MQLTLVPHSSTPPAQPFKLWASVEHSAAFGVSATVNIWFGIGAPAHRFELPEQPAERTDGLWQTTCFEAFLRATSEPGYREWNFAPSGAWAAYDFSGRREGMAEAEVDAPPYVRMEDNLTWWTLGATIAVEAGPRWELGLSAVLEEQDGTKSYWALAHADPARPDFHHPDCFVARLP
jgi:hypothetical protein